MEYVYYCMECKKFFFFESNMKEPEPRTKCKHCDGIYAIYCSKSKEEYDRLSEDEKINFKTRIKEKFKTIGNVNEELIKIEEERKSKKEIAHIEYAKSFNEFYEYDVVTIINEDHGTINKEKMLAILSEHAKKGWKLHTIYSNELGKNALRIMGLGVNSTACEDVLIFERRIDRIDD